MCLLSVRVTPFSFTKIEFEQFELIQSKIIVTLRVTHREGNTERRNAFETNSKRTKATEKSGLYQKSISNLIAATIIAKFDDVKMIIIADNALSCNNAAVHLRLLLAVITHKTGQVAVVLFFLFVLLCHTKNGTS